jgi:putative phosphoesterase
MRIALFSDVHGNAVAFDAFLTDLDRQSVEHVVCLGDHAQGGAQPAEVLEQLRERDWPAVMGNSDHFLLTLDFGHEEVTPEQIENAKWSKSQLSDELLAFQEGFQATVELDLAEGRSLLAFHGTPRSWEEIVDPWMEEKKFRAPFEGLEAAVFAGGHTHQQWARRMGDAYYVNPGSVGLPLDHHQSASTPRADVCAEYAILSVEGLGVSVEFRRIPFDVDELRSSIEASGMPHPELAARPWR